MAMPLVLACVAQQNNFVRAKYVSLGDVRVSLRFVNKHKCVIKQDVLVSLPSGKQQKTDTFRYVVCGDTILFFTLDDEKRPFWSKTMIKDFYAMCYITRDWVEYQGEPIFESSLTGDTLIRTLRRINGYLYEFPSAFPARIMILDSCYIPNILSPYPIISCPEFLAFPMGQYVPGTWYGRELPKYKINKKKDLIGHLFADQTDSFIFVDHKTCRITSSGIDESVLYHTKGSYVYLHRISGATDILLYCDGYLYDSRITQFCESAPFHNWIDNSWQEATGELHTRVYVDAQKTDTDRSSISYYFKKYFTYKNYEAAF